ncbi:MAG: hypothetical protein KBT34_02925 [Prevotella sp.]|nr:hypothetical protein [Candidatus Prevotella equi]
MNKEPKYKSIYESVSDEAMERLIDVMNDTPTLVKLADADWEVTALKPAVMNLIAKEACTINKVENASMGDVLKSFDGNLPSVVRIITLALLNDKERIARDYDKVYDTLMWESEMKDWGKLLFEVLNLLDVGFFFQITDATQTFRQMSLQRKTTMEEARKLSQGQNGGK